jgi:hypothetical protein
MKSPTTNPFFTNLKALQGTHFKARTSLAIHLNLAITHRTRKLFLNTLKCLTIFILLFISYTVSAQAVFTQPDSIVLNLVTDFGANPDDTLDDTWAFIKASKYLNNEWDVNGVPIIGYNPNINYNTNSATLLIPGSITGSGKYIVAKQIPIYDSLNNMYNFGITWDPDTPPCQNGQPLGITIPYTDLFDSTQCSTYPNKNIPLTDPQNNLGQYILPYRTSSYCGSDTNDHEWFLPYAANLSIFYMGNDVSPPIQSNVGNKPDGIKIKGVYAPSGNTFPQIKYKDDLIIGLTLYDGTPFNNGAFTYVHEHLMTNGMLMTCFYFVNVNNIHLEDIEVDGNISNINFAGPGGDGYQTGPSGASFVSVKGITCKNLYLHHMSVDGLSVDDRSQLSDSTLNCNFFADNIVCQYNQRVALDLTQGTNFLINNSDFSKTYRAPTNIPFVASFHAGIDLELENAIPGADLRNIIFNNCTIIDNANIGIVNDEIGPGIKNIKNVTFNDCTIWCENSAVFVGGNNYLFNNCDINGGITKVGYGDLPGQETKFRNCKIGDKPEPEIGALRAAVKTYVPVTPIHNLYNYFSNGFNFELLIRLGEPVSQHEIVEFSNCEFTLNDMDREFIRDQATLPLDKATFFENCIFNYNNPSSASAIFNTYGSNMQSVLFKGHNVINQNKTLYPNAHHGFYFTKVGIEGSSNSCLPNTFNINGNVYFEMAYSNPVLCIGYNPLSSLVDRYVDFNFNENALFRSNSTVVGNCVGKNSRLFLNSNSYFLNTSNMNLQVDGALIFNDGAYVNTDNATFTFANNPGKIYLDKNATNQIQPFWNSIGYLYPATSLFTNLGQGTNPITCVYGNHLGIPATLKCIPDYNQIHNGSSFSVMYQVTNALCNGANGSVELLPVGNITISTYSLDGVVVSNFMNILAGTHTLSVTNQDGCTESWSITITEPSALSVTATSTDIACNGGTSTIAPTAMGGTGTIIFEINNSAIANPYPAGTYTIQAIDANGCTATTLITITEPIALSINNFTAIDITCNNANDGVLNLNASGGTGSINYTLAPIGTTNTTGQFNGLLSNIYTLTATDLNGCSVNTSATIINPLPLSMSTTFINQSCFTVADGAINLTAIGGTLPYTYLWSDGSTASSVQNILATSIYSVVISDANNCSISATNLSITAPLPAFCCNAAFSANTNQQLLDNVICSTLGVNNISNTAVFIKDIFTIDQNFSFTNCDIYFTANASIQLTNNAILTINNCTLQAGCGALWSGIFADDASEQIIITSSTITDMEHGINAANNAKITAINNTFNDNYQGVHIFNNTLSGNISIMKNDFENINGLITSVNGTTIPAHGIIINQSTEIEIGGTSSFDGNNFDGLLNGIAIYSADTKKPLANISYPPTLVGKIDLLYNHFNNIYESPVATTLPDASQGTGVYADNYGYAAWMTNQVRINIIGNGNALCTAPNFTNCHQAIVNNNFSSTVQSNSMGNVHAGVILQNCTGKDYTINSNNISNCIIGISKVGDEGPQGFTAQNNTITLDAVTSPSVLNTNICTGISSIYNTVGSGGVSKIAYNTINIPNADSARGISLENGNLDLLAYNKIHFTNTVDAGNPIDVPWLIGINSNYNKGTTITKNVIDNNFMVDGNTIHTPNNSTGIYMHKTDNPIVSCNLTNYLQFGITGVADNGNSTQYNLFTRNIMNASHASLMLFKLGNEGTVGQVGKVLGFGSGYDANNTYGGTAALNKVYRVTDTCSSGTYSQIVTTTSKLMLSQSTSNTGNCRYDVTNPPSFTETASCPGDIIIIHDQDWKNLAIEAQLDVEKAMMVALNNIEYTEFEYGAKKLDQEQSFKFLQQNPTVRTNNPTLNSFYLDHFTSEIGLMQAAQDAINVLADSNNIADTELWETKLQEAKNANTDIPNTAIFISNAKNINEIYLQSLEFGADSLSEAQWETIENLANSCPYISGDAVYKAREIMANKNPSINYNDLQICNSQGFYRTTKASGLAQRLQQVNADYSANKNILKNATAFVYPNPATNLINLNYNLQNSETATLFIYNLIGEELIQFKMITNKNLKNININTLGSGLYTYKFIPTIGNVSSGKLIIK